MTESEFSYWPDWSSDRKWPAPSERRLTAILAVSIKRLEIIAGSPITGFLVREVDLYIPSTKSSAMGKNINRIVEIASGHHSGKYEVIVYDDGSTSCSCNSWKFSTSPKSCKHTRKIENAEKRYG